MSKAEPTLSSSMPGGIAAAAVPGVAWTPRVRRRCLVAVTLVAADLAGGVTAVSLAAIGRHPSLAIAGALVIAPLLLYGLLGLYRGIGPAPCERLRLRGQAVLLIAALAAVGIIVKGDHPLLWFIGLAGALVLVLGYYAEAAARAFLIGRGLWAAPALFVGCTAASARLADFLTRHPECGIEPIGIVHLSSPEGRAGDIPIPGLPEIADLVRAASRVEILVFGSAEAAAALAPEHRWRLHAAELVVVGGAEELQSLWLRTRALGGLIGIQLRAGPRRNGGRAVKRLIDLALAIPAGLLSAPIVALAALGIRLVDGGPSFYAQDRVGEDGRIIRVWKLRTMYTDAEDRLEAYLAVNPQAQLRWQRYFKLIDDPRILPGIGSFLRRTSLDELPQLWAIVRGQMSLVGPRPFPPYHVNSFDPKFQTIRAMVPPGLSGLWQVAARSDGDLEVQRAQDLFYILNWSIWLDLYVLLETPLAVLGERGAR